MYNYKFSYIFLLNFRNKKKDKIDKYLCYTYNYICIYLYI